MNKVIRFPVERTRQPVKFKDIRKLSGKALDDYIKLLEELFCEGRR